MIWLSMLIEIYHLDGPDRSLFIVLTVAALPLILAARAVGNEGSSMTRGKRAATHYTVIAGDLSVGFVTMPLQPGQIAYLLAELRTADTLWRVSLIGSPDEG